MDEVVEGALERLLYAIEKHQARIIHPDDWPAALGYGPWVEEVWVNYIHNAIKYGGRTPRVELSAEALPDGMVRFAVHDNGSGLAPEEQEKLFTPLEKLDRIDNEGYGLGLSIVQRIVDKLGDEVGVESEKGGGSEFFFTLPSAPD